MIECGKCGGACEEGAFFCVHCGAKLDVNSCRKCGTKLPADAKFCPRCGYPASGNVCSGCGKICDDGAAFCSSCGTKLGANASESSVGDKPPRVKKDRGELLTKAYGMARGFTVSALLLVMFVVSFFGAFKLKLDENMRDVFNESAEMNLNVDSLTVNGFDAMRAIFVVMDPPTAVENLTDFAKFVQNGDYLNPVKAIEDYGTLKLIVMKETRHAGLTMRILVWGLSAWALAITSAVFFIISLVQAVRFATGLRSSPFAGDVLALSAVTALAFSFIATAHSLAGGTVTVFVLGCLGLGGIASCKYVIEKAPRENVVMYVRRGICAVLAVLVACFVGSSFMSVSYNGVSATLYSPEMYYDAADAYDGMSDVSEYLKNLTGNGYYSAEDYANELQTAFSDETIKQSEMDLMLKLCASPVLLAYSKEAQRVFASGFTTMSWFMFIANTMAAVMLSVFFCQLLREIGSPGEKRRTAVWSILSLGAVIFSLIMAITYMSTSNVLIEELSNIDIHMKVSYSIGALPIAAAVIATAFALSDAPLKKFAEKPHDKQRVTA